MRSWLLILIVLLIPNAANAALGDHEWSQGWGVQGEASADGVGHIAVAGTFFGSLDLGGGAFNSVNFLGGDVYIGRFDNSGNHVWSKQITPGGFGFILQSMCAGPDGSIYVAGSIQNGDIDFGGGVIAGNGDAVVAGFEPNGAHRFSFLLGPGTTVKDMDANSSRLAIAGYTRDTVNFGGGALVTAGSNDVMLGVLDTSGGHVHSALFGDIGDQGAMTVALDNSNGVVLAGTALSDTDFGGGSLGVTTSALIAAGFSATGVHQWSFVHEGDFNPGGGILAEMDVDVSSTGEIGLTGQFLGSVDLGGGILSSTGAAADVFLAIYDDSGVHQSSQTFGGSNTDTAMGIRFDGDDNVAIAGTFGSPSINFGGGAMAHSGGFGPDWFVAVFDDMTAHLHSTTFGGNGQYAMVPEFTSDGALLLSGNGGGNTDFGGGPVAQTGLFLAKFDGVSGGSVSRPPVARNFELDQNSPNPFNPTTSIFFRVEEDMPVVLEIFDVAGRRVRTLRNRIAGAGEHEVVFDGRDAHGRRLASGIYRYHLRSGGQSLVRSMVLVK